MSEEQKDAAAAQEEKTENAPMEVEKNAESSAAEEAKPQEEEKKADVDAAAAAPAAAAPAASAGAEEAKKEEESKKEEEDKMDVDDSAKEESKEGAEAAAPAAKEEDQKAPAIGGELKVQAPEPDAAAAAEGAEESDIPGSPKRGTAEEAQLKETLAKEEEFSRSEARQMHDSELKRIREAQNARLAKSGKRSAEARLKFLQEQTDVFARFMNTPAAEVPKKKVKKAKKAPTGGSRGRKTEEEEDEELMADSLKGKVLTRLTVQPKCIAFGTMRPYQIEGLNWMINLYEQGINGILADEMGLGKTLQTISLLGYLKNDRNVSGPHIIIVPKSVLGNWQRELARWCPSLRVIKVHGNQAERTEQIKTTMIAGTFDVCVTTYEVVRIERTSFLKFKWRYLIMDEAHSIKNEQSRLSQVVRELDTEFRLLITGTPLQNNLRELWALLNFLLPEVFGDSDVFEDFFKIENMAEESVVSKLHAILRPFMIRRLKSDVEDALPPKREIKLFTGMTEMQTYWYKKTLSRDVAALNQLGGPEKTRLLNILMQLRKVCNHPYLFQGAEPGPPYFDGPHLWENSGKMILLDKLLSKLKANGDRVLIFSQMTRLLDILEDYMRFRGYQYCRIDGQTKGEDRDKYMAEYNEPGSSKFVFLLSTRAGGLGINLQTANIVVLYDSDWNPQMDLQAQDRAHRIGQKKEVTVFRFVTEGTVEEKIVERAEKKLYLDAVVVQQGRLQQQNKNLDKDELMTMVKFGAEAIFKTTGASVTDEDIDLILEKGRQKTEETKSKYQTDAQHNLLNFRLDDGAGTDTFMFDGENYRGKKVGNFIALPQRARKKNYDVNEYYRDALNTSNETSKKKEARLPKGLTMHDFQFFQKDKIEALEKKEHEYITQRRAQMQRIKEAKNNERRTSSSSAAPEAEGDKKPLSERLEEELATMELSAEEQEEKEKLISEGFGSWNRRDFRAYTSACERHGRDARDDILADVAEATGKPKTEIRDYHDTFWRRYKEISDHERIIDRIKKGEQKLARRAAITEALDKKVARTKNPWQALTINYGSNKGKTFSEEEDRFLVCMLQRLGYGAWDQLKQEIRKAWNFRFDWFFKSRTAAELQRRADTLVRLIEKELEEETKKSEAGKRTKASTAKKESKAKDKGSKGASAAKDDDDDDDDDNDDEDDNNANDDDDAKKDGDDDEAKDEDDDEEAKEVAEPKKKKQRKK
ncbi:ISWI chromatin-remodeling complex ATPase CHR11 [Hondaea fermentalgiana]|uniref:ISWI chromatin-remodeling complex ATPase CHR11 n=1 Tax=Hondaea fermentalgiana TaxID=2315210 RepID=A0A2R5GCY8_9STRA|nr:ISWI chromatin-remodeling complex ATPase CHR11 [Hondaea fermentalgiana]|eukprot:GBG25644.1 ISWI chromatin-remodeling complex ATPase CHR11 [Hondaea fermentalgiana]